MIKLIKSCLILALAIGGPAVFAQQRLANHIPAQVRGLKPVGELPANTRLDLFIALPLRNEATLDAELSAIYDPNSNRFRKFMTPSAFQEAHAPDKQQFATLLDYARRNKLKIVHSPANRKFVHVETTAGMANHLFHVTLLQYRHPTEHRLFYAPDKEPSIDLELRVSHVSGLDNYVIPGRVRSPSSEAPSDPPNAGGSGASGRFTGRDFRAAYAPGVTLTGKGEVVGVIEFNGYDRFDVLSYLLGNGMSEVPLQNVYINGYTGDPTKASPIGRLESTADIEMVMSMAPGLSKVVVYGSHYAHFRDLLNEIANPSQGEPLPAQVTTSYYFPYDKITYDSLKQFAAQGQALFVASGDWGSYDEVTGAGAFPPADHPLVTSVGGTVLSTSGPAGAWTTETAWALSGGGHSPWSADPEFAIPWWQSNLDFAASGASNSVRNSPDVSMVSTDISVFADGAWQGFAGTSASAPLWAGYMALVNEHARTSGRGRIGFANPALYSVAAGLCSNCFHDITSGNNFNSTNPAKYSAVPGYDLVTGWGSPNGLPLIQALANQIAGWRRVPGGGTTYLPDATAVYRDRLYLFSVGGNDKRHYSTAFDGNSWTGWKALPGGGTTNTPQAAAVYRDRLFLFAIGGNDRLHYVNRFDGNTWNGWSPIPGGGTTALSDAATVYKDRLYLFAVGTGDRRHYMNVYDGQSWAGWTLVPGGGTTSLPQAAAVFRDQLYLFAIGIGDKQHYSNSYDGKSWSGWKVIPGGGKTTLASTAVAFGDRLSLFAVGASDHRHYVNSFDGANWIGWKPLASGGTTNLRQAAASFRNRLYLFAVGVNDKQHYWTPIAF